jgi:hypothetical protein
MSDEDSMIMRKITPDKHSKRPQNIQEQVTAHPTLDIGSSQSKLITSLKNSKLNPRSNIIHNEDKKDGGLHKTNDRNEDEDEDDEDGDSASSTSKHTQSHIDHRKSDEDNEGIESGDDEDFSHEQKDDDDDDEVSYIGGGDYASKKMKDAKLGTIITSRAYTAVGSMSSVGGASLSTFSNLSLSSSIQDSIMNRLLLNIAHDPEPFGDFDVGDIRSNKRSNLPEIERPKKRPKMEQRYVPSQSFPDQSLPTEFLDDFISYTQEHKARNRYEMGKFSDVTLIIMNYALINYRSLKKFLDPEQLNIRWMFEFWKSKEVKMPSLYGGRNEYSQKEERAIEHGLYKYPPYEEKDMKGQKVYTYRWGKIFLDETYHELLKERSPRSIKDKARGTRNREGESIIALYHVQGTYRLKLRRLQKEFSVAMDKKKKELIENNSKKISS